MSDVFLDFTSQSLSPGVTRSPATGRAVVASGGKGQTPFWGDSPDLYDTIRFGKDFVMPGVCTLRGKAFSQRVQRDQPPGKHGASLKQLGRQPCKIDITLKLWTAEHLAAFERLIPVLKAQRTKTFGTVSRTAPAPSGLGLLGLDFGASLSGNSPLGPNAGVFPADQGYKVTDKTVPVGPAPVDVYHPLLAMFRIRSLHILDVSFPEPTHEPQVWEVKISCEEFIAQRSTTVTTASQSMELVESNPLIGKTAVTNAREAKTRKPSELAASPGPALPGDFRGGSSGGF